MGVRGHIHALLLLPPPPKKKLERNPTQLIG
jgi:hypothetical protein